ncbi:MAG TPA: YdcF family protein [Stellaceae bacterium]|nr:YdcF family protein [Stellaceae bacterium]
MKLRRLGLAAAALLAAYIGGLVWFAEGIVETVEDTDGSTDAIVVLTGGSQRVQTGLQLLTAGKAKKLFVSGVYHGTDVTALLHAQRQSPESVQCCIALGHAADNTYGNALETAAWMRQEGFRSLRLVTANYHMRRALLEFARAMPEVRIVPHPVFPDAVRERWWAWPGTLDLIIGEYDKYLWALARPWFSAGSPEAEAPA